MTASKRPLSPHLQVYRLPLLAILSITHRITGVALAAGAVLLAVWLGAAAYGPDAYATVNGLLGSLLGRLVLFGFTAAYFFHLANGIRHLFWDAGKGFDLKTAQATSRWVIGAAVVLTLATWAIGLFL